MRGQANLPALAVALLVVTTVTGLSVAIADSAFASAERDAVDRSTATATVDRLVAADSPVTERRNVVDDGKLDRGTIERVLPPEVDARVTVGGEMVYERGDPTGGSTARRLALLAERQTVRIQPPLKFGTVTLPRRTPRATISVDGNASVETVRANDRVVLHDPAGLDGEYDVSLSRYETTTLRFDGDPEPGDVTVTFYPRRTSKALVEVTVDA